MVLITICAARDIHQKTADGIQCAKRFRDARECRLGQQSCLVVVVLASSSAHIRQREDVFIGEESYRCIVYATCSNRHIVISVDVTVFGRERWPMLLINASECWRQLNLHLLFVIQIELNWEIYASKKRMSATDVCANDVHEMVYLYSDPAVCTMADSIETIPPDCCSVV